LAAGFIEQIQGSGVVGRIWSAHRLVVLVTPGLDPSEQGGDFGD
jgi:hypothetical protein